MSPASTKTLSKTRLTIFWLNKNFRPLQKISPSLLLELRVFTFYLTSTNLTTQGDPSSLNIKSLYTVIFFYQLSAKESSSKTLLRLAELVLTLNFSSFGGNHYKQNNGVAIDTRMDPATPIFSLVF